MQSKRVVPGRIALDAMGGDNAPRAILEGALRLITRSTDAIEPERILLVGDEERVRAELREIGEDPGFEIAHAAQVIEMHESPSQALRKKPDSSIAGCVGALRAERAAALVSMGNTGAVVGASTLGLGTLQGVRRPGIAVTLNLTGHPVTLLDMGANVAPKPEHLRQYGLMGAIFVRDCLGIEAPRIGLLNIGSERSKGTDLLKNTHELLAASKVEFVGNLEANDIFENQAEVVVTDGFTGNVVLKLLEGFSSFMLQLVLRELKGHGVTWAPEALENVRKNIDYAEYGGALLLGTEGIVVIGHGRSDPNAVANALHLAARAIDARVNEHIVQGIARTSETEEEPVP